MKLKVVHNAVPAIWVEELQLIERRVTGNEQDAMKARWEFGRMLLARRGTAKLLPRGVLDEVSVQVGLDRSEVRRRLSLAGRFSNEQELAHAVSKFPTWHLMVHEGLVRQPREPKPRPSVPLIALRTLGRHIADLRVIELSESDWSAVERIEAEFARLRSEANEEERQSA